MAIEEINRTIQLLIIPTTVPDNINDANDVNLLANNRDYRDLLSGPYGSFIKKIFMEKEVHDVSGDELKKLITDSNSLIQQKDVLENLVDIINLRNNLMRLQQELKSNAWTTEALRGHADLVKNMRNSMEEIVHSIARLKNAVCKACFKEGKSHRAKEMANFLKVKWKALSEIFESLVNGLNNTSTSLELLAGFNIKEKEDLELSLSHSVTDLDKSIQIAQAITENTAANEIEDELCRSFVMVAKPLSANELEEIGQSWVNVKNDNSELQNKLNEATAKITALEGENKALIRQEMRLTRKVERLETIDHFVAIFRFFINQYQNRPKGGFFHHHGDKGKSAATKLLNTDIINFEMVLKASNLNDPELDFKKLLLDATKDVMRSASLTGNYHPHSLKSYVLAFYNAISVNEVKDINNHAAQDTFKDYFEIPIKLGRDSDVIERAYNDALQSEEEKARHSI